MTLCTCLLSSCNHCSCAIVNKFFKVAWLIILKKYIYMFIHFNLLRNETMNASKRKQVTGKMLNRWMRSWGRLRIRQRRRRKWKGKRKRRGWKKRKKKKAAMDREKRLLWRRSTYADGEMRKRLENETGEDVPSGRAININRKRSERKWTWVLSGQSWRQS